MSEVPLHAALERRGNNLKGLKDFYMNSGLQGYLAHRNNPLLGLYSRATMPRAIWRPYGGGAVSYERGTPVDSGPGLSKCSEIAQERP